MAGSMSTGREAQEVILSALIKDSYLFSVCKDEMTDGYFSDPRCKIIYKSLSVYYQKYGSSPNLNELLVTIDDCYYPHVGADISDVKDTCCKLFEFEDPDELFIKDKITDFLRKVRSSSALKNFIDQIKVNPNLESDEIVNSLSKALEVQLTSNKIFNLNDPESVREARSQSVGSTDQSRIVRSFINSINSSLMFGGWQPSTVNMIVAPPGTGKSVYLINEGAYAAKQGFEVLHIFIGDLVEYDGFIRYISCISGTPQNNLIMVPVEKQMEVVKLCNQQYDNIVSRLSILAYPSLELSVENLMEEIHRYEKKLNKDYDVIIIDYPDNLVQKGVSLYTDGGTLYSSLERLARLTRSVVLVASQPKQCYWSHSIIPLEAASESSKKQAAIDVMVTMNTETRGADFGTLFLAKTRKGQVGKIIRFSADYARCRIQEISESEFNVRKSASKCGG